MINNKEWIEEILNKITTKMSAVTPNKAYDFFPYTTVEGKYVPHPADTHKFEWWTNGFYAGIMWLLYKETKDEKYITVAQEYEEMLDIPLFDYDELHHDVGFMWLPSSVANFKLTGNEKSRKRGLLVANVLAGRYNLNGKYIRAWNGDAVGWSIIDCMMNIPLLYWASIELKDPRFSYIANAHADTTIKEHIREDGSVRHIVVHDHINGGRINDKGGQGYADGSSWSRGQAWALYGFIISYMYTKKQEYLDTAKRVAHYFIANVCDDWLPKCDFRSPIEPVLYDSTAGAIAACGLIEIAKVVPKFEKDMYLNPAINMLKAMEGKFCNWETTEPSILQMGTESYHSEKGKHIPIIYGDYYFIEAISKLKGDNILFW